MAWGLAPEWAWAWARAEGWRLAGPLRERCTAPRCPICQGVEASGSGGIRAPDLLASHVYIQMEELSQVEA